MVNGIRVSQSSYFTWQSVYALLMTEVSVTLLLYNNVNILYIVSRVLALDSQHEGSDVPSLSGSVDEEEMRSIEWLPWLTSGRMWSQLGTCESFFCVRIESRIESAVRIEFSNRIGRIYSKYLIHSIGIYFVFVTNESDARN